MEAILSLPQCVVGSSMLINPEQPVSGRSHQDQALPSGVSSLGRSL